MKPRTLEEEENHVCTKENAQKLAAELFSFIVIAHVFCNEVCDCENGDEIKYLMKYIRRLADELFCELEAYDVRP